MMLLLNYFHSLLSNSLEIELFVINTIEPDSSQIAQYYSNVTLKSMPS